jgi:hypothetical protein
MEQMADRIFRIIMIFSRGTGRELGPSFPTIPTIAPGA